MRFSLKNCFVLIAVCSIVLAVILWFHTSFTIGIPQGTLDEMERVNRSAPEN
jgi:hypothetical protein